jgi:plastocyanin
MKKVAIALNIVVFLMIFSFYGCVIADETNSGSSTTPSSGPTTHIVKMTGDYEFVPSSLTIKQGDSVEWVVTSIKPHEVQSGTVIEGPDGRKGVPDGLWDSGKIAEGGFTYTFKSIGTFPYYCDMHVDMGMIGEIIVVP